ncbi:DegT/DnrJ/EryC1/StrS family aminotransferase [bacterium LRH843]|nr:DegT/DnrJ/EryC1/StrS family aminotransferase [bacterium LRH843]
MIKLSQPIISDEAIKAVSEVLKSGMLVQGRYVELFEKRLSDYIGAAYTVAVSSGTAALHVSLAALGISEGDAVFVPAFTFPATVNVVELQRARPILVDVEINTYNIDPIKLEQTIKDYKGTEKPKAIIVVHEFGAPANMTEIMKIAKRYDLYVIEDAACALGTKWNGKHVGTFGDAGCFSFHPRKAITTGEGGVVVVKDEVLFKKVSLLRNHGIERNPDGRVDFMLPGFNYRLTDFQAILGVFQLEEFDKYLKLRKEYVNKYYNRLRYQPNIRLPKRIKEHAWQTFMIILSSDIDRNQVIKKMRNSGIETNLGAQAIHLLGYYKRKYKFKNSDYPISKILYDKGLALPLHPNLDDAIVGKINDSLIKSLKQGV